MLRYYSLPAPYWLAALCGLLLSLNPHSSQAANDPIYSNTGPQGAQVIKTCTTIKLPLGGSITSCFGEIENPELATDEDFTSAALVQVPASLLGGSIKLRMDLASPAPGAPTNYRAGVVVSRSGGLLHLAGLSLANRITIRTLKKNGSSSEIQESLPVSAALAGAVLGPDNTPIRLEFVASKPFDQIEIEAASFLALGYELKVYYAYAIDANVVNTAKGYVSRFDAPTAEQYSTQVIKEGVTVCVETNVKYSSNAVDQDLTNYAIMGSLLDLSCPTTLQTQLEGTAPAGYEAGFVIGNGGLLDVSVLAGLRVTTYRNGVEQEQGAGTDLLNLELLPNGQYAVHFAATKPFDRVELQRSSLLSALDDLRVYYGFGLEPRVFHDEQPRLSEFVDPAGNYQVNGALVCVNCSVSNPQNVADDDLKNNYATVQSTAALTGTTRLKMRLNGPGQAGNTAGVILGLGTQLLDADLLASIRVNTYTGTPTANGTDGSVLVESAVSSALLNVEVLADGRREISFRTTRDFDWVEVELTSGVALLNDTRVYYGFAEDRPTGFPGTITPLAAPLPVQLTGFSARANGPVVEVAWQTAAELNSDYFEVQRSANPSRGFAAIGRVPAAGTTSAGHQYTLRDAEVAQLPARTLYYRLHQVDTDGTETYSQVAVVTRKATNGALAVYPNPAAATDLVRVATQALPEGQYQVLVYDTQGRLVSQQPVAGQQTRISAETLRPGLYHVVLQDAAGQRAASQRLVIIGR